MFVARGSPGRSGVGGTGTDGVKMEWQWWSWSEMKKRKVMDNPVASSATLVP